LKAWVSENRRQPKKGHPFGGEKSRLPKTRKTKPSFAGGEKGQGKNSRLESLKEKEKHVRAHRAWTPNTVRVATRKKWEKKEGKKNRGMFYGEGYRDREWGKRGAGGRRTSPRFRSKKKTSTRQKKRRRGSHGPERAQ